MRLSRELIIIVALLLVYVFDLGPRTADLGGMKDQLLAMKQQIAREKFLGSRKEEVLKQIQEARKVDAANKTKLYPAGLQTGTTMSEFQNQLKLLLQKNGLEVVNMTWGEPVKNDKAGFSSLPISFTARGYPSQVVEFLHEVQTAEKITRVALLSLRGNPKEDRLDMSATVLGYQLLK